MSVSLTKKKKRIEEKGLRIEILKLTENLIEDIIRTQLSSFIQFKTISIWILTHINKIKSKLEKDHIGIFIPEKSSNIRKESKFLKPVLKIKCLEKGAKK